jgi:hypothetical protein
MGYAGRRLDQITASRVSPWGPTAAYCVYGGVPGYSIYAGGDYLGAERFDNKWLHHIVGLRDIVRTELG